MGLLSWRDETSATPVTRSKRQQQPRRFQNFPDPLKILLIVIGIRQHFHPNNNQVSLNLLLLNSSSKYNLNPVFLCQVQDEACLTRLSIELTRDTEIMLVESNKIRIQTTMTSDKHHNSRGIKDQDFHLL